jgi:hypothetical protein
MASKSKTRRRQPAASQSQALRDSPPSEGRTMSLVKQGGVVVGLISGVIGLFFLLFPQFRPERNTPTPDQSASVTGFVLNPRTTQGQFLDYAGRSKRGFTTQQLDIVGASAFARVQLVGYRGKHLTLERQVIDTQTGNLVGQARDFLVTPPADKVTHRWADWAPLPSGRGSYMFVIKVLGEKESGEIACGQSENFGGADGPIAGKTIHVCEQPEQ